MTMAYFNNYSSKLDLCIEIDDIEYIIRSVSDIMSSSKWQPTHEYQQTWDYRKTYSAHHCFMT